MTIIAPVAIDGLDEVSHTVQQVIPAFNGVFSHVTLLKNKNSPFGISVLSLESLAGRCKRLQL